MVSAADGATGVGHWRVSPMLATPSHFNASASCTCPLRVQLLCSPDMPGVGRHRLIGIAGSCQPLDQQLVTSDARGYDFNTGCDVIDTINGARSRQHPHLSC